MALDDRARWDEKHAAEHATQKPSSFLKEIFEADSWPLPKGRALDIATGKGGNAIFLAERGFQVVGIDISPVALEMARRTAQEKSLAIDWQEADLERIELPKDYYDLVVNFNYLQRSLVPQIKKTLKPGGWVIFETYLTDQSKIGHPINPDYLLLHNELLDFFRDFRVLYYRERKFLQFGGGRVSRGAFGSEGKLERVSILYVVTGPNECATRDGPHVEVDPGSDALAVLLDDRHSFALESVPFIFVQNFEGPLWVIKPIDLTYDAISVPTGGHRSGITTKIVKLSLKGTGTDQNSLRLQ